MRAAGRTLFGVSSVERVAVGGTSLQVLKAGSGRPCVVLHRHRRARGVAGVSRGAGARRDGRALPPGLRRTPRPDVDGSIHTRRSSTAGSCKRPAWSGRPRRRGRRRLDRGGDGGDGRPALRRLVLVDAAGVRPRGRIARRVRRAVGRRDRDRASPTRTSHRVPRIYGAGIADFGGEREAGRSMTMRSATGRTCTTRPCQAARQDQRADTRRLGQQDPIVPVECALKYQRRFPGRLARPRQLRTHGPLRAAAAPGGHHRRVHHPMTTPVLLLHGAALHRLRPGPAGAVPLAAPDAA